MQKNSIGCKNPVLCSSSMSGKLHEPMPFRYRSQQLNANDISLPPHFPERFFKSEVKGFIVGNAAA
jgi:hypothetical protein